VKRRRVRSSFTAEEPGGKNVGEWGRRIRLRGKNKKKSGGLKGNRVGTRDGAVRLGYGYRIYLLYIYIYTLASL
jgi:hypothetical protein